jgi:hypothetical protein
MYAFETITQNSGCPFILVGVPDTHIKNAAFENFKQKSYFSAIIIITSLLTGWFIGNYIIKKLLEEYLGLDKTYLFEVLVGFQTDTYDLLGLVKSENEGLRTVWPSFQKNLARRSEDLSNSLFSDETLNSFIGTFIQKYPSFSSKTVGGKQLFQLSKDDELPDEMPEHEVTITKLSCTSTEVREKEELQKEILRRIGLVKGDFSTWLKIEMVCIRKNGISPE